uniref:cDNA FLJ23873 fis, clone LNG12941 n=1 Tax=Homo sapiens TaxID=9606 RepID=Q8TCH7_HUMAN|nr:unnamed protein product [Homo sapiens]
MQLLHSLSQDPFFREPHRSHKSWKSKGNHKCRTRVTWVSMTNPNHLVPLVPWLGVTPATMGGMFNKMLGPRNQGGKTVGVAPSLSSPSPPLECVLKHWDSFDSEIWKKKQLIFFCTRAWPSY